MLMKGASWRHSGQVRSSLGVARLWLAHASFSAAGTPGLEQGSGNSPVPAGRKGTFQLDSPLGFCHLALTWVHYVSVEHTLFKGVGLSYYPFFFLHTEILIAVEDYSTHFWKRILPWLKFPVLFSPRKWVLHCMFQIHPSSF